MDGTPLTQEEPSVWWLHSLLAHGALGEVPVPGFEQVMLVGVNPDRRVHFMHSLFTVWVNVYSTECRIFVCLGELPVEVLAPVM